MKTLFKSLWLLLASAQCLIAGTPLLVSTADTNLPQSATAGGMSGAARMTPDGRYLVFVSEAGNLTTNAHALVTDVFLRDRTTGAIQLISLSADGASGGNADSFAPAISADGQWIAFQSTATNLTAIPSTNTQIYLRDVANNQTRLISAGIDGTAGNGESRFPLISADGRWVAFESDATNLVAGDTNRATDVFVYSTADGTLTLASPNYLGTAPANGSSSLMAITPDGLQILLTSKSSDLAPGITAKNEQVFVRDQQAQATYWASMDASSYFTNFARTANMDDLGHHIVYLATKTTNNVYQLCLYTDRVSGATQLICSNAFNYLTPEGTNIRWNYADNYSPPQISAEGRYVAYVSPVYLNSNLVNQVYVWDATTGLSELASVATDGVSPANAYADRPLLSADGRSLLFTSVATNLVAGVPENLPQIYLRNLDSRTTQLVSANREGTGSAAGDFGTYSLNDNGTLVLFESAGSDLVENDFNRAQDVFLRQVTSETTECLSLRDASLPSSSANGSSFVASRGLSASGQIAAFTSLANNLTPGDTNQTTDVYWRDLSQNNLQLVSRSQNGVSSANAASAEPAISADGRYLAYVSGATDLAAGDTNPIASIYWRDITATSSFLISSNASNGTDLNTLISALPWISPDGQAVGFLYFYQSYFLDQTQEDTLFPITGVGFSAISFLGMAGNIAVSVSSSAICFHTPGSNFVKTIKGLCGVQLSQNHSWLVAGSPLGVFIWDMAAATNSMLSMTGKTSHPAISNDGRWLVFENSALLEGNTNIQVYLYDLATGTHTLVSKATDGIGGGTADSTWPQITADGRFVVFESQASNLMPNDNNGATDVFAYNVASGAITCLSLNQMGTATGNGFSGNAVLSDDSAMVMFGSWASDLVAGDYNQAWDVFMARLPALAAPRILSIGREGDGALSIQWSAQTGTIYQLQYAPDLASTAWTNVGASVTAVGSVASQNVPWTADSPQGFYRVLAAQ